jgi:hypothetical protein
VIRIWELDPQTVFRLVNPSLVPWAPLMKTPDPVATMLESREIIRVWNPELVSAERKAVLQAALAVFSGLVIKDMDMISALFEVDREWLEQGLILACREALLSVLNSRFAQIEPSMVAAISRIDDPRRLRHLLARAVVVRSLEEFARELQG